MDKSKGILNSTDSEFLNFLYKEREREYAMSSAWGINYWIVGAAIVGLLGYAYHRIAKDYEWFDWQIFTYYAVALGAILIAFSTLISPLMHNNRWKNKYRVTSIATNFPFDEICWKGLISNASFVFLVLCVEDYGPVTWLSLLLMLIEIGVFVYATVNGEELILVEHTGHVFSKNKWEILYRGSEIILCFVLFFTALYTWGSEYEMGVKEFEMACVLAILVGVCWVSHNRMYMRKYHAIDDLIDKYIYGSLTKEDAYFYLQIYEQGYDITDILQMDCDTVKPFVAKIESKREEHKEYLRIIKEGKMEFEECKKYLETMRENLDISDIALNHAEKLNNRIKEIATLNARSESAELFVKKIEETQSLIDNLIGYAQETADIVRQIHAMIDATINAKQKEIKAMRGRKK